MTVLCIDDEVILLRSMQMAVEKTGMAESVIGFSDEWEGLRWAEENRPDIAFLDIRLHDMDGLELAQRLKEKYPELFIVFCTGFSEYAVDAINRGLASGYLLKPVKSEQVYEMMEKANAEKPVSDALITVRCYGGFEVFDKNGKAITFHRKRAKELLALLVDRKGMSITSKEICAMMFEDDGELDLKNMDHLRKLFRELKTELENAGAGDVLIKCGSNSSVDPGKIKLDESGKDTEVYLPGYVWVEK